MSDRTEQPDCAESSVDCRQALEDLYTFLDRELTPEVRSEVDRHLDHCEPCVDVFDFHAELKDLVQRSCTKEVPDELRRRILAQLEEVGGPAPSGEAEPG